MTFTLLTQQELAPNVYRITLSGDTRNIMRSGQFVQIALPGFYLRRPISVCDCEWDEDGKLTLIYKVVGDGTVALSRLTPGATLDLLTGLGNGYDISPIKRCWSPLLVGGGVGIPPLYGLCKSILAAGREAAVVLGFNTKKEVFLKDDFEALGVRVCVCTADGSMGMQGVVTDVMQSSFHPYDYVYACGPEPMLKAVHALCETIDTPGQFSFEERMACGFGVCMGCSCETRYGSKRICKDGPVLFREEIIW